MTQSYENMLQFYVAVEGGHWVKLADVQAIDEGRRLWTTFAGFSATMNLEGVFEIRSQDGKVVYNGDYVTDEC